MNADATAWLRSPFSSTKKSEVRLLGFHRQISKACLRKSIVCDLSSMFNWASDNYRSPFTEFYFVAAKQLNRDGKCHRSCQ
jgi:hypothetical protein